MATLYQRSPSWLDRLVACCGPPSPGLPPPPRWPQRTEKDIWSDEPAMTPPPTFAPQTTMTMAMPVPGPMPMQMPMPVPAPPTALYDDPYGMAATSYAHFPSHGHGHAYSGSGVSSTFTHTAAHQHNRSGSSHRTTRTTRTSHTTRTARTATRNRLSRRPRPRTASSSLSQSLFASLSLSLSSSSRRPLISAPTNFQHVHSGAFVFPELEPEPEPAQVPPAPAPPPPPKNEPPRLDVDTLPSPLLPALERSWAAPVDEVATPPPAHTRNDSSASLHSRSGSAMSFHLPRRPVGAPARTTTATPVAATTTTTMTTTTTPPIVPPRSRLRAHSSPAVESMVERIASAMIEMERLQAEIDSVVERQSVYGGGESRPGTAVAAYSSYDDEITEEAMEPPLPAVPAWPGLRLRPERPKTAPPRRDSGLFAYGSQRASASAVDLDLDLDQDQPPAVPPPPPPFDDLPLAPPLPLVLRPPLRKKKSFSRVSTWLFPPGEGGLAGLAALASLGGFARGQQQRSASESTSTSSSTNTTTTTTNGHFAVTNAPLPVTHKDGFYSVVLPEDVAAETTIPPTTKGSPSTVDTLSTWTDNEYVYDEDSNYHHHHHHHHHSPEIPQWPRAAGSSTSPTTTSTLTPTSATTMTTVATLAMAMAPLTTPPTTTTTTSTTSTTMATTDKPALAAALLGSGGGDGLGGHRPLSVGVAF